jgi:hypothetical protein
VCIHVVVLNIHIVVLCMSLLCTLHVDHHTQVIMFVKVSGFGEGGVGIFLPQYLRNPGSNTTDVTVALIRWLSPHRDTLLRDDQLKPICPPPFDINHALWNFHSLGRDRRRKHFIRVDRMRHLDYFPGTDVYAQRRSAEEMAFAHYDLVQIESIEEFMNCTIIDGSTSTLLETITIPFVTS